MKLKSLLDTEGKDYFYIMHLSYGNNHRREPLWDYAKENEVIGLDLPGIVDDSWNKEKVKELARRKGISAIWEKQFDIFYEMERCDIVMILSGWKSILGVAKVADGEPKYDKKLKKEENFFEHIREVSWLKKYDFDKPFVLQEDVTFYNTLKMVKQDTAWGAKTWTSLVNIELP